MRTGTPNLGQPWQAVARKLSLLVAASVLTVAVGSLPAVSTESGPADVTARREAVARRSAASAGAVAPLATRKGSAKKRSTKTSSRTSKSKRVFNTRATWYGPRFHGRRTASGERFNRHAHTLASRSLPFGTRVRVTNLKNGKSVVGRVNDRGPFKKGYGVDLSQAMARKIGLRSSAPVKVEVLPKK